MSELKQINNEEGELIFNTIREERPDICLECGTSNGEGSTYSITKGLAANGKGVLFTFEKCEKRFELAKKLFSENPLMEKHVVLQNGLFEEGVEKLNIKVVDFVFLDGPNNAEYTMGVFKMLEPMIKEGGIVILHDWNIKKCKIVKNYITESDRWEIEAFLRTKTSICKIRKQK